METRGLRETVAAAALTLVVAMPALLVTVRAQAQSNGFPDLVGALKATPGVLGVDATRGTLNGKMVIFTWFENKKAALAWYYSDAHQALMRQFSGGNRRPSGPMPDVPDDGRPILAIASLTMPSAPPAGGDLRSAVTQIAIELYSPLPGGLAAGGRFAPSTVKVPGMLEVPLTARTSTDGR
jgi:heme-degrading monooxygenase HmoA